MKRSQLLEKTSPVDIFLHFIPNLDVSNIRKSGQPGRNISSPFLEDNNPSFSVYQDRKGHLKYKCHSSGQQGDCFQLVADLHQLDCASQFPDVMKKINDSMRLGLEKSITHYRSDVWQATYYSEMTRKAKGFWSDRNIDAATLDIFGVRQMKTLTYRKNKQQPAAKYDFVKTGATAFEYTVNARKKLYMPASVNPQLKGKKKYFCKTQTGTDIFGWRQLPRKKAKYVLICEGESDVMCAYAHGLSAVCFQSANAWPTKKQIRDLKRKGSALILCYDMDEAGRKGASKIAYRFPSLINLKIPTSNHYAVGNEKDNKGLILYFGEMNQDQKDRYVPDPVPTLKTYKDLSDWLPCDHVSNFKSIIDRAISDHRKKQYLHLWEQGTSYMKFDKKSGEIVEVSNFLLEVDAQIIKGKESFRLCRFISRERTTDTIAVPSNVLNSDTKFQEFVGNIRGNFRFAGSRKDLLEIQKMTFALCDYLEEIPLMGWNGKFDCFVMSNAVLNGKVVQPNAEGVVDTMYIPAANEANLDDASYAADLKFRYQQASKIKAVHQFYAILENSYTPQIASVSFSFLFAGLFFDWIARKGVSNWFPLLGLFGQKGSGKGSLVKMLMQLFTSDPEEVSITNTTKTGFVRTLEQMSNIPGWLDEFRNSISNEKIEGLKNIYDLIGKTIGIKSNDSKTKRSKILRPTFLTGQEAPVNEALFSRVIALNLAIVRKTPEQVRQFSQDMTELNKGIGDLLFRLLKFRPIIIQEFKGQFFKLVEHFGNEIAAYNQANRKNVKANIRLLNNYACITAPLVIALKNGLVLSPTMDAKTQQLTVVQHALAALIEQAKDESELDEVNKFLEVVMIAATQSKPLLFPGHDFVANEATGELIIKASVLSMFNEMYEKIYKHKGPDQSALKKYIKHKPYFIEKRKIYFLVTGSDHNTSNARKTQLWGYVLDLKKLPEETSDYFNDIASQLKDNTAYGITN